LYGGRRTTWKSIITPEQCLEVGAAQASRDSGARRTRGRGLLSGLLICKECGAKVGRKRDKESARRRPWLYMCRNCNRNSASADRVSEVVAARFIRSSAICAWSRRCSTAFAETTSLGTRTVP